MRQVGLAGLRLRRRHRTTVADPAAAKAPGLMGRGFTAKNVNTKYVGDTTYLSVGGRRFCHLATVIDLASRRLGDGRSHACRARHRRPGRSRTDPRQSLRGHLSYRPRGVIHIRRARLRLPQGRHLAVHEREGRQRGQRARGVLQRDVQAEALQGAKGWTSERKAAWRHAAGCTVTTPVAVTPDSGNAVPSPTRQHSPQHQLSWRQPHNPCPRFQVKPPLRSGQTNRQMLGRTAFLLLRQRVLLS